MRVRLVLPMRFAAEKRALAFIRDNGLFGIGAQVSQVCLTPASYRVVIVTQSPGKAEAVARHVGENMLQGVTWEREETPQ